MNKSDGKKLVDTAVEDIERFISNFKSISDDMKSCYSMIIMTVRSIILVLLSELDDQRIKSGEIMSNIELKNIIIRLKTTFVDHLGKK